MNFHCTIKDRKFKIDKDMLREYLETQKDGEYILEIRRSRKKSNQTMRYYYKIMAILAKEMGLYPDDIKSMIKKKLNHYEHIKDPEGNNDIRFWSTANYTPEMFNDAIELVIHWGAINNIYIMTSEEYKLQFES